MGQLGMVLIFAGALGFVVSSSVGINWDCHLMGMGCRQPQRPDKWLELMTYGSLLVCAIGVAMAATGGRRTRNRSAWKYR
jgi:hypothetical protein